MKRVNHLVLGSITVLASIALAGLFIFPASGEGEQHYVCNLNSAENRYECTLAEEGQYTCNYDNNWGKTRCARGEEQLNFCKNEDLNGENITCYPGYTRSDNINGRYYFTENAQNFSGNSYCEYPDIFQGISTQGESILTCDYYGNTTEHYNFCREEDEGTFFCRAKYVPDEVDGGVAILSENSAAESGYAYCDVMPIVSSFGNRVLDSKCYSPNMDPENGIDCFYNENEFICPMEHRCDEGPGGMFCYIGYDEGGYYCASDNLFNPAVDNVNDKNNSCLPINEGTKYNNCEYINGMGYFCPTQQSCELDTDGYHCDSEAGGEYTCYPNINIIEYPDLDQTVAAAEPRTFSCEKAGEEPITNCQIEYYEIQTPNALVTGAVMEDNSYLFCPVEIKYDCLLNGGMYECSPTTGENNYFYCNPKPSLDMGVVAGGYASSRDYYCEQPKIDGIKHSDCDYDYDSGKFMCLPNYKCDHKEGGYQCDIYDGGEYRCELPSPVLAAGSMPDYVCSGPNTYNNCYPNNGGYFCPEEVITVKLDLYMGGCISNGIEAGATEAIEDGGVINFSLSSTSPVACSGAGYLGSVTVTKNSGVDVAILAAEADLSAPEVGKQWIWYLDNNKSQKLTSDKKFDSDSKLYVFQDAKETKPSGGYSGGGGSSSKPSSKGSGPSTSEVKSTENEPTTPAKEVKAEPKPVVPGKGANSTGKVNPNQELFDAYEWAYANGLTKYSNMSDARMDDLLNRQEMAKISTIFATKFQGETPNEKKRDDCSQYPDLWKTTKDMQEFIIQSCELGYMGYRANGIDYLERFRPYTPVSVAEVSIILSRIMWQNKYAISENLWYQGHLHAVYENNLLDNISKPFDYIARKDAYIMLYRISKSL